MILTFSPVGKMSLVQLFISLVATHHWSLSQLDNTNAFFHGILEEEVYVEQSSMFVAQEQSGKVCKLNKPY